MRDNVNCRVDEVRYFVKIVDVVRVDQVGCSHDGIFQFRLARNNVLCHNILNIEWILIDFEHFSFKMGHIFLPSLKTLSLKIKKIPVFICDKHAK